MGDGRPSCWVRQVAPASSVRCTCSSAAGGMRSPSDAMGTSHIVSPWVGWATAVMPKLVGSPASIEVQVTPSSSER